MTDKTICICSDSQAALLALGSHTVSSRLVLQCRNSLQGLSIYNRVQLFWAPGHCGMVFLRMKNEMVLWEWDLNPPSAGRNLVCRNHVSYCNLVSGCRHSKVWIKRPCLKLARFLRNLPRNLPYSMANLRTQIFGKPILSVLIDLLTGHVRLNNHLHTMGLLSDPTCAACGIYMHVPNSGKPKNSDLTVSEYEDMSVDFFVQFAEKSGRFETRVQ
jgi:hypothetical protein